MKIQIMKILNFNSFVTETKDFTDEELNDLSYIESIIINALYGVVSNGNQIFSFEKVGFIDKQFFVEAVKRSMGHIVEGYVLTKIKDCLYSENPARQQYRSKKTETGSECNEVGPGHKSHEAKIDVIQTNNDTYDADVIYHESGKIGFNEYDTNELTAQIEVKAYNENVDNISFTKKQKTYNSDKLIYIFVNYTNTADGFVINNIHVGKFNDVSKNKTEISRHGSHKNTKNVRRTFWSDQKLIEVFGILFSII